MDMHNISKFPVLLSLRISHVFAGYARLAANCEGAATDGRIAEQAREVDAVASVKC